MMYLPRCGREAGVFKGACEVNRQRILSAIDHCKTVLKLAEAKFADAKAKLQKEKVRYCFFFTRSKWDEYASKVEYSFRPELHLHQMHPSLLSKEEAEILHRSWDLWNMITSLRSLSFADGAILVSPEQMAFISKWEK